MRCGTPGYVGPEVLHGHVFTDKADIFSLGSFFFNLITSSCLFRARTPKDMLHANKYANPYSMVQLRVTTMSPDCKHLLHWMLQTHPSNRPSAEQCLKHRWFSEDRDAIQSSLYLNRNTNAFHSKSFNEFANNSNEFASFIIAPNYY